MSGRLKKVIWFILMAELVTIHLAVLGRLCIHGDNIILGILLAGSIGMAAFQYLGYRSFIKEFASTINCLDDNKTNELFLETVTETGMDAAKVRIYESSDRKNLFVLGVVKPSIILPTYCKDQSNLKLILLHECFHVKRGDTRYKLAMLIANCFLWFNPVAFLIRYLSYQDIEISCDEAVIKGKTKEERLAYGQFLIDSVKNLDSKGNAFSAYWNSNKRILKNRIDAVVKENRKWNVLGKIAIVILALEVVGSGVLFSRKLWKDYHQSIAPINEYEGATIPNIYNDQALENMLSIDPYRHYTYDVDSISVNDNLYPYRKFAEITVQAESPWQIRLNRPAMFREAAETALQRLYFYLENQTAFSTEIYEASPYQRSFKIVYEDRLAGDINNSVWGILWKVYCNDIESSDGYKNGYAFSLEGEENYLYYATAVQIKMTQPYLFQVVGYADLYQVIDAFQKRYGAEYKYFFPHLSSNVITQEMDLSDQESLAKAFAESKGLGDCRVSFPENAKEGYLLATADMAMMQVYSVLYKTEDGGKSWMQVPMDTVGAEHSVVYDFAFINGREGYMATHSFYENLPNLLLTQDGGYTWERISFGEKRDEFCQAFVPVWNGEKYVVYVGKEGSAKGKGEKACYESSDGGKNWAYTGQIILE